MKLSHISKTSEKEESKGHLEMIDLRNEYIRLLINGWALSLSTDIEVLSRSAEFPNAWSCLIKIRAQRTNSLPGNSRISSTSKRSQVSIKTCKTLSVRQQIEDGVSIVLVGWAVFCWWCESADNFRNFGDFAGLENEMKMKWHDKTHNQVCKYLLNDWKWWYCWCFYCGTIKKGQNYIVWITGKKST